MEKANYGNQNIKISASIISYVAEQILSCSAFLLPGKIRLKKRSRLNGPVQRVIDRKKGGFLNYDCSRKI